MLSLIIWPLLTCLTAAGPASIVEDEVIEVGGHHRSKVIPESFVAFSIEFAFFPDFAGNRSHPNLFSNNLLNNLGELQGTKPYIRVGGNTQDYALYNPKLKVAKNGTIIPSRATDYPTKLQIGSSFFESYDTWPDTKYIHGFNLGKNSTTARKKLLETVPLACKALKGKKLLYWELGNEPDLFSTSAQGPVRPPSWNEQKYVNQWLNGTREIRKAIAKACPDMARLSKYKYISPSFAGTSNTLDPVVTWNDGLNKDKNIAQISSHNYIGGATEPGVTLQGTLMNHSMTVSSISSQLDEKRALSHYGLPFILGETNSLYNEGAPGLSNAFGAALWGVDFNLWCASQNISRVHMHQGSGYRYAAWQPVETKDATKGTKAPYYGNVAVAAALGDLTTGKVRVANLPLKDEMMSSYATYMDGTLKNIVLLDMHEYNYTINQSKARPTRAYRFRLPRACASRNAHVQRLMANGSNAITGITFDGYSYNHELKNGLPVRLHNVTVGETTPVNRLGIVEIRVPDSSAAIVSPKCSGPSSIR